MSPTYHSPLHKASCHDNDGDVLFPDHSPEISHCLWNRTCMQEGSEVREKQIRKCTH